MTILFCSRRENEQLRAEKRAEVADSAQTEFRNFDRLKQQYTAQVHLETHVFYSKACIGFTCTAKTDPPARAEGGGTNGCDGRPQG